MGIKCISVLVIAFTLARHSECLVCYGCPNISDVNDCNNTVECQQGQSCFLDSSVSGQSAQLSLGCRDNQYCGGSPNTAASLVGREILARELHGCYECCSTDNCNKHLCTHLKPTACIDDAKTDCAWLSTLINLCSDVHHAKTICPKFCGLCTLVDGNWATWSEWSTCDVTCGNGTERRTRTCTDPAPADGGLDCVGDSTESKQCNKQLCPVHGGWTKWSEWESCSVACGTGIQKRHRNCTNPVPQRFGNHCFGDTMDDRLCMPGPCTDGGWSSWVIWSSCTVTCGTGVKSRSRTCSNPRPSPLGKLCDGDPFQVASCSSDICPTSTVSFSSKDVKVTTYSVNQTIVFHSVLFNEGNGYNGTTGIFTAPVSGTYLFTVQLVIDRALYFHYAITYDGDILKEGYNYDQVNLNTYTFDAIAMIKKGGRVWVKCAYGTGNTLYNGSPMYHNSFSGVLVQV